MAPTIARLPAGNPCASRAGRLRRCVDFACGCRADLSIGRGGTARDRLEVDAAGLDAMDRRYLSTNCPDYVGGPSVSSPRRRALRPRDDDREIIGLFTDPERAAAAYSARRLLTSAAFRHLVLAEPRPGSLTVSLFDSSEGAVKSVRVIEGPHGHRERISKMTQSGLR